MRSFFRRYNQNAKSASNVECLQPWSITRWGDHREVRIVEKCKKVREFLGLGDEDKDLIEEVKAKRSCRTNYNPIVKLKFNWNLINKEKDVNLSCNGDKVLQELDHVHKMIERNIRIIITWLSSISLPLVPLLLHSLYQNKQ